MNVYMDDIRLGPSHEEEPKVPDWKNWITVRSIDNVIELLDEGLVDELSLDHDMGESRTGYDLVKWMAEYDKWPRGQIWIHSANPVGKDNMMSTITRYHPKGMKPIIGEPEYE